MGVRGVLGGKIYLESDGGGTCNMGYTYQH